MFTIKTKLAASPIQGVGVFAEDFIPKGTVIWRFEPKIDRHISKEDIASLLPVQREYLDRYIYLDKDNGMYVFCADDGRFMNHQRAELANCGNGPAGEDTTITLRDIQPGEELTVDYEAFDPEFDTYKDTYTY